MNASAGLMLPLVTYQQFLFSSTHSYPYSTDESSFKSIPYSSAASAADQVISEMNNLDEDSDEDAMPPIMKSCKIEVEIRETRLNQETKNRKLESRNRRSTMAGVASLLIFTSSFLVLNGILLIICRKVQARTLFDRLSSLAPYFEQWNQFLSIYNPFMHLMWNKELSLVLKKWHIPPVSHFKLLFIYIGRIKSIPISTVQICNGKRRTNILHRFFFYSRY